MCGHRCNEPPLLLHQEQNKKVKMIIVLTSANSPYDLATVDTINEVSNIDLKNRINVDIN